MNKIIALLMVLFSITLTTCKKEAAPYGLKIQSFLGEVTVVSDKGTVRAEAGQVLAKNSKIVTGSRSMAVLLVAGRGIIRIAEKSTIQIASLIEEGSDGTQIDIAGGSVFVLLAKLTKGYFTVRSPLIVASVRGTSFRVVAGSDMSQLYVLKGAVKLNPVKDNRVVEKVEKVIETNHTAELTTSTVENVAAGKKEISVRELRKEEIAKIREEIKDIKPELIQTLDESARRDVEDDLKPQDSGDSKPGGVRRDAPQKQTEEKDKPDAATNIPTL